MEIDFKMFVCEKLIEISEKVAEKDLDSAMQIAVIVEMILKGENEQSS